MNQRFINSIFVFFGILIFAAACHSPVSSLLHQQWKTIKVQNQKLQQQNNEIKAFLDSLSLVQNNPQADSLRRQVQATYDQIVAEQARAQDNTLLEFTAAGIVYMSSPSGVDSAAYSLEDPYIHIDESKLKGEGEKMTFEILHITSDTLRLQFVDQKDTSIITLVPTEVLNAPGSKK